jgi:hypothetical protein
LYHKLVSYPYTSLNLCETPIVWDGRIPGVLEGTGRDPASTLIGQLLGRRGDILDFSYLWGDLFVAILTILKVRATLCAR